VTLSTGSIMENAGPSAATGTVTLAAPLANDLTVFLTSSDPSEATVPLSVFFPAGATTATFDVAAVDELIPDGSRSVQITAYASGFRSSTAVLDVVPDSGGAGSAGISSYNFLGDRNLARHQGQVRIEGNIIQ